MNAANNMNGQSRSHSTAEQLRAHILLGVLVPGEHLGQAELAQRFNMSKVPVREALKQLHAEGLLDHDHNRGYFVSRLSYHEAIQLYKMRRWIESELLQSVRWPDADELQRLRELSLEVKQHPPRSDRARWTASLGELRKSIFALSPETLLFREALRLWSLTDRYRAILPADRSALAEAELLDCLEARDRNRLLKTYHADRDRIEGILEDSLAPSLSISRDMPL